MAESRNYAALDWVVGEIGETLKQARQALEAYVENPQDSTRIRFCLTHIHQVHGSLQMLEFSGAALLAQEMEALAQALMNGQAQNDGEAHEVLMRAILQLPIYLEQVKQNRSDDPVTLLPLLNDLRAVRGSSLLSGDDYFKPNIDAAHDSRLKKNPALSNPAQYQAILDKLRKMYQYAAAGVIRGVNVDENLLYLDKVFTRLHKLTEGTTREPLWELALALCEALQAEQLQISASVKSLLRELDKEIKFLAEQSVEAFNSYSSDELLKNLLYYIARSGSHSPRIEQLRAQYELANALDSEGQISSEGILAGPDPETMRTVVSALNDELEAIKHALDMSISGHDEAAVSEALPVMQRVADTLSVLGAMDLRAQLLEQISALESAATQGAPSNELLMSVASDIINMEQRLAAMAEGAGAGSEAAAEAGVIEINQAQESVLREARNGLEQSKDAIIEYIASQWNTNHLKGVPALLSEIRGGLAIIPLSRPAMILQSCGNYIDEQLLQGIDAPDWHQLDTLADAIASVEYYLERLSGDRDEDDELLLGVAEESVAQLGYPIAGEVATPPQASSADVGSVLEKIAEVESVDLNVLPVENVNDLDELPTVDVALEEDASVAELTDEQGSTEETTENIELVATDEAHADELGIDESSDVQPATSAVEDDDDELDDEILEIFIEESEEVLAAIDEFFPEWARDQSDKESLKEFRRAFHTLKGSGRMVGANDLGELAWAVESLLNGVLDSGVQAHPAQVVLIANVRALLPEFIEAFQHKQPNPNPELANQYIEWAAELSRGELPAALLNEQPQEVELNAPEETNSDSDSAVAESSAEEVNEEQQSLSDDDDDAILWDIFGTEAQSHLAVVEGFIAQMADAAPLYTPPSESMQRALHTLKGSAHMADVYDVATLATPLERFAKELRTYQVNIDDDILQLLRDGVTYTRHALNQIREGETVAIEKLPQFLARVGELRELSVVPLISQQEEETGDGKKKIDPELLSIFMAEEMNLLLDADELLLGWQAQAPNIEKLDALEPLSCELDTLATGAEHACLPAMAELSGGLFSVYKTLKADLERFAQLAESDYNLLLQAHEQLLDMVDGVAAGQNLKAVDTQTMESLSALCEQLASVGAENNESLDAVTEQESAELDVELQDIAEQEPADEESVDDEVVVDDLVLDDVTEEDLENKLQTLAQHDDSTEESLTDIESPETERDEAAETEDDAELIDRAESEERPEEISDSTTELSEVTADLGEEPSAGLNESTPADSKETEIQEAAKTESASQTHSDMAVLKDKLGEDFDEEILEIFLEEADELNEEMEHAVHDWEADWNQVGPVDELKRCLHTIKGGARLSGLMGLGEIAHDFETYLIDLGEQPEVSAHVLGVVHDYQDKIHRGVERLKRVLAGGKENLAGLVSLGELPEDKDTESASDDQPQDISADDTVSEDLTVEENTDAEEQASYGADILPFTPKNQDSSALEDVSAPVVQSGSVPSPMGGGATAPSPLQAKRQAPQEVVKVSAELLEELVNLAGETSIGRGRMEEQVSEMGFTIEEMDATINRLQDQLRRLDIETEAQVLFRQEQLADQEDFDPLEMDRYSQLQQLSRSLLESASDLMDLKGTLTDKTRDAETLLLQQSRINTDLQEGLMRSRMVPFSRLVPRLRRIVRQVASELGKQVNFELDNVEGELDRTVLERMIAPLEHMLRNAVDHGIESPAERVAAGKPEAGRVLLSLAREGGDVMLRLIDDGKGIDLPRVREKAIERGLMTADANLSDRDIMQFILHAGFSTADAVTQISGRGVGMDVVNSEIKQLGGAMSINSETGVGSEFTVRLPFTVSVNRALMIRLGDDRYAIPLNNIEGIVRVSPFELEHYYQDPQARFEYAGENYQVRYLGNMLNTDTHPKLEGQVMPLPVVLVRTAQNAVAMQVDMLMGSREIVVKSLGQQFSTVQGVSGATVMGDGSVVVILDPHAMIRRDAALAHMPSNQLAGSQPQQDLAAESKTIMVVDDSVTVRKVTTRFLEREGYSVITAKDGADALLKLQDHLPDAMLLDIEMPRMDGFEVAKNVRSSSRLKHLPIIMITSRTGDKHREHAESLGVNKYMGKPFQEDKLLHNIRVVTGEESDFTETDSGPEA